MQEVTLEQLKQLALQSKNNLWDNASGIGRDVKIYLHWTAGRYNQFFDHYHISIDGDGKKFVSTTDLSEHKDHTYRRNTGAIGIALNACYNANTEDLGDFPPTDAQIEALAQVVAVLAKALDLTVDVYRVMTHDECANNLDGINPGYESNGFPQGKYGYGYSCERWDLLFLKNGDAPGTGGATIRGKANYYINSGQLP